MKRKAAIINAEGAKNTQFTLKMMNFARTASAQPTRTKGMMFEHKLY